MHRSSPAFASSIAGLRPLQRLSRLLKSPALHVQVRKRDQNIAVPRRQFLRALIVRRGLSKPVPCPLQISQIQPRRNQLRIRRQRLPVAQLRQHIAPVRHQLHTQVQPR